MSESSTAPRPRRRDPVARRRAMVEATAELICEVGVANVSHRGIAERANVPLGSTTQYFESLDDARSEGLAHLRQQTKLQHDAVAAALAEAEDLPGTLADLFHAYLSDAEAVSMDSSVWAAAVHDQQLASEYEAWSDALTTVFATRLDPIAATIASHCLDGLLMQCALRGSPPGREELLEICRCLIFSPVDTTPRA